MFQLELLELLNKTKRINDNYELNNIKNSISKLISQNKSEYEKFTQTAELDEVTKEFLIECEKQSEEKKKVEKNEENHISEISRIKNYFVKWQEFYVQNNKLANVNCENIILELINFYLPNRFEVLEKLFKLNEQNEDFQSFIIMLKNYLRIYFVEKIEEYMSLDNYNNLGFFLKRKKKNQILFLLKDIGEYKFNIKEIEEVLK